MDTPFSFLDTILNLIDFSFLRNLISLEGGLTVFGFEGIPAIVLALFLLGSAISIIFYLLKRSIFFIILIVLLNLLVGIGAFELSEKEENTENTETSLVS